jgi:four helix bundle protein
VDVTVVVDEMRNCVPEWLKTRGHARIRSRRFCVREARRLPSAIEFLVVVARIISELPSGNASLTDPPRRAALSVPVNVAEGVGRSSAPDRRRHYAIARGSAMECAAILDACRVLQLASPDLLADGRSLLLRVVQRLSKMCA